MPHEQEALLEDFAEELQEYEAFWIGITNKRGNLTR